MGEKVGRFLHRDWELKRDVIPVSDLTFKVRWARITSKLGNLVVNSCKNKAVILDVGAGDGSFYSYIEKIAGFYIGLDPSEKMIEKFNENTGKCALHGCAEYLPVANSKIDALIFNSSIDHCIDPGLAMLEASRVLKPGGRIFILLTNKNAWYKKIFKGYARKMQDLGIDHNFHFTFEEIKLLLEKNNFQNISVRNFDFLRLPVCIENLLEKVVPQNAAIGTMDFFDMMLEKTFINSGGSFICTATRF